MQKINDSIKNIIRYGDCVDNNTVDICYGIDNNFVRGTVTSIVSIYLNNKQRNFRFHIIISNLTEDSKKIFSEISKKYIINIIIYEIDINIIKENMKPLRQMSLYFRFIFPLLLHDKDKIIYIDGDIICLNNAEKLFDINLTDNIIAAISDTIETNKERFLDDRLSQLDSKNHIYFNAGLLVINVSLWNKLKISEKAISLLNEQDFHCKDQDVLNLLTTNKVKYLPKEYNCINIDEVIDKNKIVFLHLTSSPKPWCLAYCVSPCYSEFRLEKYLQYEKKTPYVNILPTPPITYKEKEHYAKLLRNKKYYKKYIYWYLKYIYSKIKSY